MPVPLNATLCGELVALSVSVRVAASAPLVDGVKTTEMVQFPPAATLVPQVLVWLKLPAFAPARAIEPMVNAMFPLFVTVTVCAALALPTVWPAKVSDVALKVAVARLPVPLSATLCGEPDALSAMLNAAVRAPAVLGENATEMVQLPATATLAPQVFVWLKLLAFVPVSAIEAIANEAVPVLVRVTVCAVLEVPTVCPAKVSAVTLKEATGDGIVPVPLSATLCGELPALSVRVSVPVSVPPVVGAKNTEMVQLPAIARPVPQVLVWLKLLAFVPVTAIEPIDSAALPVFVTVKTCAALEVPVSCAAKVSAEALTNTPGVAGGLTVPVLLPPEPQPANATHPHSRAAGTRTRRRTDGRSNMATLLGGIAQC